MAMTKEEWAKTKESIRNMKVDLYLQVDVDRAAQIVVEAGASGSGELRVNDIRLVSTSDENAVIELKDDEEDVWQNVELRWSHHNFPIAKCDCAKGREHIRCEHLIKALLAFAMLGEPGLVKKITKSSHFLYLPLRYQKI